MHTCCDDTLQFNPVSTGTLTTRLGEILFMSDDVYIFSTGLAGFREYTTFVRAPIPHVPKHLNYGMLQSLENADLSFILFYPTLDADQHAHILGNVRSSAGNEQIHKEDIDIAFLVIINKEDTQKTNVTLVQDAPLVFIKKTQTAWQIVLL